jgi:hypothetical protein
MGTRLDEMLSTQRALRSRFDDFRQALRRENRMAMDVALVDFERHFRRWTDAEERSLVPALLRAEIAGRNPQRELRLEYVQIRELTRFLLQQLGEGVRSSHLIGYVDNLDRRLHAHEKDMGQVYYPAAEERLTDEEWTALQSARPGD